jgi:hypothetical protein
MGALLLGLIALIGCIFLFRLFVSADPKSLIAVARHAGIALLLLLIVFFSVTERWLPAVFLAGIAWSLYTEGRLFPENWSRAEIPRERRRASTMSREEALRVLGLGPGASADDIREAHRRLIRQNHPDTGGSDYLASKINEAKDVLLG